MAEHFQPKLLHKNRKRIQRTAEGKEEGEGQTILPCKEGEEEAFLR